METELSPDTSSAALKSAPRKDVSRLLLRVAAAAALLVAGTGLLHLKGAQPFLSFGGATAILDGAATFWNHATLAADSFQSMHQELLAKSANCRCGYWQDVYGLGVNGHYYPARAIILSVLAAPFAGLAGIAGLWLLNSIIFVGVVCAFFVLSARGNSLRSALFASTCFVLGSGLLGYTFGIHYDLWSILLLLVSLVIAQRYPLVAGFLMALMLEIRPTHLLFLPLIGCVLDAAEKLPSNNEAFARYLRPALGVSAGLLFVGAINWYLWGRPWVTGFERMPNYDSGHMLLAPTHPLLDMGELLSHWGAKLFGAEIGILNASPVLVLGVLGFLLCKTQPRRWRWAVLAVSALHLMLFASDPIWANNSNLVRYSFPNVVLLTLGIAPLYDWVRGRLAGS